MIYYKDSIGLREVENNSVSLLMTHPPYLEEYKSNYQDFIKKFVVRWNEVLKDDSYLVIVTTDNILSKQLVKPVSKLNPKHIQIWEELVKNFILVDHKVWVRNDKKQFGFRKHFSNILIFKKGNPKFYQTEKYEKDIFYIPDNMRRKVNGIDFRDAYPIDLCDIFIMALTEPKDIVIDPFAGVGTTIKSSERLNRVGIGYEIDERLKC